MAIDINREDVVSLRDAASILPKLRQGKRIHVNTLYRWASRGIRGVRLEVVRIGRTLVTSREAIQRFVEGSSGTTGSRVTRSNDADRAEAELDAYGL